MAGQTLHDVRADAFNYVWDNSIAAAIQIDSGDDVELHVRDASDEQITADSGTDAVAALDFSHVNPVSGPVFVKGAKPGDTLAVEILELRPRDWGWTAIIPGFGLLADEFSKPAYHVTRLGPTGPIEFMPGIRLPRAPFCGVIGVAPAAGPLSTIPPDVHGGNMDTRHLVAGSTLYLPVFQPGARISIGDGHATQGDGEVCGTAIETPMRATVKLTVRKDIKVTAPEFLAAPDPNAELRNGRRYSTDGVGPDLLGAAKDATRRMIDWLGREHGMSPADAYMLCSTGVDLRISEIVDMPNYLVTAYCPLGIFD